ncbi:carbohydrate kinase family protein [Mucilaginibacter sp. UR6-11]|uniref:carbohydrate kinase family protein n=1 Tax=Mucilaginibacter sp. UR6-11 TaxID=1435644 RepID=UPI001E3DE783|nr:PfkB family carbohydrate kinase [Mucilaginibacter sp. UR6-11]MCC8424759.1 PfkB family carbohydrate kinase [Mucilaginibacter sp. UR6-11]
MRNGILVGGNWIIDQVKVIDVYPDEEKLANILTESSCNGGSAYNVIMGLSRLKVNFPLSGVGLVGDDDRGNRIISHCQSLGINTAQIHKTKKARTSYTDVMSVQGTGKRTFFHQRGANALLNIKDFDFSISQDKIFHLGYLLLLDQLDIMEADGTTRGTRVLKDAKEQGLITSADIVSERSNRFKNVIPPSLPYIDYLFVNEYEAGMITDVQTIDADGSIILDNCYEAARKIVAMGVNQWVVLHFPQAVIAVNKDGGSHYQASIKIPSDKIMGASGAGDAFAAGVLTGVHNDWDIKDSLRLGVCAAASSLFETTSSDGILPLDECLKLATLFGYREAI